ncbi:hypothetical protein QR680_005538 [Steinernema hermaphroditum]|uniref:Poly A polymerase head domain-containing protein n=1 Tax=Steinernema hermaphroditum TaxID=289476 RepID=A0AA39LVK1_9BILA|nr:hypothetical protein QR680_005538 [Steinernema hermaphroditum]
MNKFVVRQFCRFLSSDAKQLLRVEGRIHTHIASTGMIEPKTYSIAERADFRELFTPELSKLVAFFESRNHEIRMAGGAVRDLLMGIKPSDVDFASTATPTEMKDLFEAENIRMLHKRGEEHGTITCRIDDKENFEITTLRVDVLCDGRRAEVQYTTDWQLDANRRDLTINSLFLDMQGNVIDYFGGIEDCMNRRVNFVGDPARRIQEDYLRILRYFRFYGRIANSTHEHNAETLKAIRDNKEGLQNVSGERVWTELRKILVGRFAGAVIKTMLDECQLNRLLGLQPGLDLRDFVSIEKTSYDPPTHHATMLAALLPNLSALAEFHKRAKISNAERGLAEFIIAERDEAKKNSTSPEYFMKMLVDRERAPNIDRRKLSGRECVTELMKYVSVSEEIYKIVSEFESPEYPIRGTDLMDIGAPKGKAMRELLQKVYEFWRESNFTPTQTELLEFSKKAIEDMSVQAEEGNGPKPNRKRKSPTHNS